ncbi:hypothetical protein ACFSNO_28025 [Streptomyces cirratus]
MTRRTRSCRWRTSRTPRRAAPTRTYSCGFWGPDGDRVRLGWDAGTYPYVSDAAWESAGEILLTVQDRLQQTCACCSGADPVTGVTRELSRTTHPQWVDPLPGTPARLPDGRMLTAADTPGGTARALALDGKLLTGDGIQVRRVAGLHEAAAGGSGAARTPPNSRCCSSTPKPGSGPRSRRAGGAHRCSPRPGRCC